MQKIQDLHVITTEALIAPRLLKERLAVDDRVARLVVEARQTVRRIIRGEDPRLMCIVGPCSIHDPAAALDYAERLARLRAQLEERLFIVMRVYFEKPRTTVGWKGMINDPYMDDSCDMHEGLFRARRLLLEINALGLPAGTEMLDPITPQYIADLVSWTAIGARTTESQTHREMASGLSMPVGFKNSTEGNLQVAVNAIESARRPHSFIGITQDGVTAIVRTTGNPDTHVVLRGGRTPNYDAVSIDECCAYSAQGGLGAARDGRLLARPDRQGLSQTARSVRRVVRAGSCGQPRDHGRDARELHQRRQPAADGRPLPAQVRSLDNRPLYRLAGHRAMPPRSGRGAGALKPRARRHHRALVRRAGAIAVARQLVTPACASQSPREGMPCASI